MATPLPYHVHPIASGDRSWVTEQVRRLWGGAYVVAHGVTYYPDDLPGFLAIRESERVGLIAHTIEGERCQIVALYSLHPGIGVGSGLVEAVKENALSLGCRTLWLTTTNDNLDALGFYQKRGFVLKTIHRNAAAIARQLKPELPVVGLHGIPVRDEIDLEMPLAPLTPAE